MSDLTLWDIKGYMISLTLASRSILNVSLSSYDDSEDFDSGQTWSQLVVRDYPTSCPKQSLDTFVEYPPAGAFAEGIREFEWDDQ